MAVEMRAEIRGMTRQQYEQVVAQVQDQLRQAPGFVMHAAGPLEAGYVAEEGYRVVEIWNSREECERFFQQTVAPIGERVGLPAFEPQFLELDNVVTAAAR